MQNGSLIGPQAALQHSPWGILALRICRLTQSVATPDVEARAHSPFLHWILPPYSLQDENEKDT